MTSLSDYGNIYADLAQGSYNNRYHNFVDRVEKIESKISSGNSSEKSLEVNFNNAKDVHGNDVNKVYLQRETDLMSDSKAGYSSYFLTDTQNLDQTTQHLLLNLRK